MLILELQILMFLLSKREIQVNSMNLRGCTPLDVLLESPRENGDLLLAEMIRKAGGMESTAPHEALQQLPAPSGPNSRSYFHGILEFFQPSNDESTMRRNNEKHAGTLMLVATIIATITFQAALNPPGGFKQDNGKVVLGNKLSLFLKFDMVGLFAALSVILVLICATPRRKKMVLEFLACMMWVSVFSTALAFLIAVFEIFPESNHPTVHVFLKAWLWIFRIAIIWADFRFTMCLLRKVGWLKTKEKDRCCFVTGAGYTVTAATRIAALLLVIMVAAIVVFLYVW